MLTKRRKQVLDFIKSFRDKRGYSPSLEEIKRHFHLASVSTAHHHVKLLEELGYLKKQGNSPRSIDLYESQPMVQIPILGRISAGQPILAVEDREIISVPQANIKGDTQNLFALKVEGQSMIDENINSGDVVIVRSQQTAEDGQKVVALINNEEVTLKKLYREKNRIRLQPANSTLDPIFVDPGNLIIQGVVIDTIKTLQNNYPNWESYKNQQQKSPTEFEANKIICGDCTTELKKLPLNSIDVCITDPPYNYEFIGHKWNVEEIQRRTERVKNSKTLVKHIPYGSGLAGGVRNNRWYERNAQNVKDYREWCSTWGKEVFRVLKPGAYVLVFNSTRTIAHVQVALENAGFYARDIIVWRKNSGIPKGLNFSGKLKKEGVEGDEKWKGWHSCLRNEWEAIALLQKPLINNYPETVKKFDIGLLHTQNGNGGFQSNIIENVSNKDKKENFNIHCTVKPVKLIGRLIDLVLPLDQSKIVLDPFLGSGTTAIAALDKGVSYLGIEINEDYCRIAQKRIDRYINESQQKLF